MKKLLVLAAVAGIASTSIPRPAEAAGCIRGALVGGIAGHLAGHGVAGAAAGCAVGHHYAGRSERRAAEYRSSGYGRGYGDRGYGDYRQPNRY